VYASYTDFACFSVSIELTDEGVGHVDEIVGCVFAYVGMLLREGPEDWIGQVETLAPRGHPDVAICFLKPYFTLFHRPASHPHLLAASSRSTRRSWT
jgi:hypothetical protein